MTFKINDLKENINYKIVACPEKNYCDVNVGDIRYITDEKFMDKKRGFLGSLNGNNKDRIYGTWEFTLVYPISIEEAAKHLDAHCPGWAAKIKTAKLEQGSCSVCVLGQLYISWQQGIKHLYDLEVTYGVKPYCSDEVFGTQASVDDWKSQISLRLNEEIPVKSLTFLEAVQALTEGKKVRRPAWDKSVYLYLDMSTEVLKYHNGVAPSLFTFRGCNDWEVVKTVRFSELKAGQKFHTLLTKDVWIKAINPGLAVRAANGLDISEFHELSEVKVVNE